LAWDAGYDCIWAIVIVKGRFDVLLWVFFGITGVLLLIFLGKELLSTLK